MGDALIELAQFLNSLTQLRGRRSREIAKSLDDLAAQILDGFWSDERASYRVEDASAGKVLTESALLHVTLRRSLHE